MKSKLLAQSVQASPVENDCAANTPIDETQDIVECGKGRLRFVDANNFMKVCREWFFPLLICLLTFTDSTSSWAQARGG